MKKRIWILSLAALFALTACKSSDGQPTAQEPVVAEQRSEVELASVYQAVSALDANAQRALTPDEVLKRLKEGNKRFVDEAPLQRDASDFIAATSIGQFPSAIVLGCVDSRVSPETVFDQGIGDIFSARVAGNIIDDHTLGSIEFATKVAGSKLVVVKGHTECGAVKGSCDGVELGHITSIVNTIQPSVEAINETGETCTSAKSDVVDKVATHNVERTIDDMRASSEILRELEASGAIKIVGAMYDVSTGRVNFL